MSDVQKTEEVPAAAPAPAAESAKDGSADAAPAAETPAETPAPGTSKAAADDSAAAEDAPKEESNPEIKPASEGFLGYKAPGLVKGLRFSKRFCWFSDDAVEIKQLTAYFQNEKLSVAHPTAAWASQTGKGLLFFAKRAEDKAAPTGIINLADISDIAKESANEFHFKLGGHKHTFQAANGDERTSWIVALEAKATEAKNEKETITSSDGYKAELEKMTKPPVVAAAAPKKSLEKKESASKEGDEESKEEEKKEEKSEQKEKSRSQSRKRASIFGSFLAKKDEEKKEDKKEEKADAKDSKSDEAEAAAPAAETPAPAESTTEAPAATEEPKDEEKKEAKPEPTVASKAKRASIFGSIFQKVSNQEKAEKDAPPKNTETPVSSTAPQLGDPVDPSTSEPIKPESVTAAGEDSQPAKEAEEPVASPASTKSGFLQFIKKEMKHDDKKEDKKEAAKPEDKAEKKTEEPVAEPSTTTESTTTPPAAKEKRRTSFFGNLGSKKEKKSEAVTDGEQAADEDKAKSPTSSPLPKFGGVFRRASKAAKKEKEPAAPSESEPIPEAAEKPEENSNDSTTEPAATVNGAEAEGKTDAAAPTASSSQPVQAAA
ncbi:conserved hypothetical protein [Histoplasma capsulatum var. duboisii H88]|uniref:Pleckstrin homology domain protein n=1 Tax=Ajellomyces capsulatus (strain H88) TaxID=544711 RepID=F0U5E2_AJEC8|nr:conserved hypothetical protein [Histoplasma capsulatum var. duboisii H88]QSS52296.1 pleckstrin homology domain protein [Histoplasma capsulatum var. duboisii H88]